MDILTESYYAANAGACSASYEAASVGSLHELLRSLASPAVHVLEIGGGSGRDAAFLVQLGCDTTYTDGCEEMVAQAVKLHPELASKARVASFPLADDDQLLKERYDMVLCAAVIMHLDDGCLERLTSQMTKLVALGGHLVLSHSFGREHHRDRRDTNGRLFLERPPATIDGIFEARGFLAERLIEDRDGLGRPNIRWTTHLLQKVP